MVYERDPTVAEYQHERHRPREADALLMLRKIASLVKPIMRQRGWRVGVLTEFYPEERNLLGLNVNRGERICLRLRYATDERQFMPIEQVTDTMLHELSHIVHGPHDEHFHNLWNQLRDEYENLLRKGYTGEGFLSQGRKLGGRRMPMHEAQRRARAAAEERRNAPTGSGQRLGGAPVRRGQDIRKVIADAVTRRNTVMRGCASGVTTKQKEREIIDLTNKNGVRTKADDEDENEEAIMLAYIDLVQEEEREKYGEAYIPPSRENPAGSRGIPPGRIKAEEVAASELASLKAAQATSAAVTPPVPTASKPSARSRASAPAPNASSSTSRPSRSATETVDLINPALYPTDGSWACEICTLVNPPFHLVCDACGIERAEVPTPPPPAQSARRTMTERPKVEGNAAKAVRTLREMDEQQKGRKQAPLTWRCGHCGQYTESEWWTCANCGEMKTSS